MVAWYIVNNLCGGHQIQRRIHGSAEKLTLEKYLYQCRIIRSIQG